MPAPVARRLLLPAAPAFASTARRVAARYAAEAALAVALLVGWGLVTLAVARLVHRGDIVWPLSLGLLLLSASGWRLLALVVLDGLYTLTRDKDHGE